MRQFLVAALVVASGGVAAGADDPAAVLDKAIKALGGPEKLEKVTAYTMEAKGTVSVQGNDNKVGVKVTYHGIDHMRQEIVLNLDGVDRKGFTVQAGNKGWRKFDGNGGELEGDVLANQKRGVYVSVVPTLVMPLKGKGFKVEAAGEEKIGDKSASILKVTGPDGKDFTLAFDKETGLPAKLTATMKGFTGGDVKQETIYSEYKEMDGIQKATKVESKREGQTYMTLAVSSFKVLDKVDPKLFTEPE